MIEFFVQGGLPWMSLMTIEFVGVMLAAWKAPGWVKEAGLIALATGALGTVLGFAQIGDSVAQAGGIAPAIIWVGVKVALITAIYGIIIYGVSLIIRIIQKPKLL
jgi:hypothetical protein